MEKCKGTELVVYLSGDANFREDIATIKGYKENRKDLEKPAYYDDVTKYLLNNFNCIITDGIEADDAMAIEQCKNTYANPAAENRNKRRSAFMGSGSTIIATTDKDLNMVPGWHYNWQQDRLFFVEEFGDLEYDAKKNKVTGTGLKWFYTQMLLGDITDNIQGCPGIGHKTAYAIIDPCTTEEEMLCEVGKEYALKYDDPESALIENARLLWMLQEEGVMWEPLWNRT
jgi:5'-3' exonuclease